MKRGPRFTLLDEKSHTAKKCRREIFPESEEAATDITKITCIDAAIDTGDVTVLDNGLSPDGRGGSHISRYPARDRTGLISEIEST